MASSGRHEPRFSTSVHLKLSACLSRLLSLQCCVMSWKLGGSKWRSGLWVSWRGCGSWVSYGRARRDRGPGLQAVDSWALAGLGRLAPGSRLGSALLRGWSTRSPASEAHAKLPVTSRPCTSLKCPWLKQATWPSIASVMGVGGITQQWSLSVISSLLTTAPHVTCHTAGVPYLPGLLLDQSPLFSPSSLSFWE